MISKAHNNNIPLKITFCRNNHDKALSYVFLTL